MNKATNKTLPTSVSVDKFIEKIKDDKHKKDAKTLVRMMSKISGEQPVMWGSSIIGFGNYHYRYKSGREGDMGILGFSPRSTGPTIYLADGTEKYADQLAHIGPHKTGKVCLYLKSLDDVDTNLLEEIITASYNCVMTGGLDY